ncbi:MAG: hypothetical protein FJW20_04995 [Acidimicrobiia bacterium]|nr:hypothetical protein [Acidimicrobiia bacterium]
MDFAFDYVRALGERTSVFAGLLIEKPLGFDTAVSLNQGITYALHPNLVVDVAVQQPGLAAGLRDYRVLTGLVYNFGRVSR